MARSGLLLRTESIGYREAWDAQRALARARAAGSVPDVRLAARAPAGVHDRPPRPPRGPVPLGRRPRRRGRRVRRVRPRGADDLARPGADRGLRDLRPAPRRPGAGVRRGARGRDGRRDGAARRPARRRRHGPLRRRAQARQRGHPGERRRHLPRPGAEPPPRPGVVPPHDRMRRPGRGGDLDRRRGRRPTARARRGRTSPRRWPSAYSYASRRPRWRTCSPSPPKRPGLWTGSASCAPPSGPRAPPRGGPPPRSPPRP